MIPYEVHNLPVHPLAVHAAVVFVPLSAFLAILFVIPRTRKWAALPMAVVAVGALVSVYVARVTGFNFKQHFVSLSGSGFKGSLLDKLIADHESKANLLYYMMIVFALICVAVYLVWLSPSWMPPSLRLTGVVEYAACAILVVGAVVVGFQTYRTGEAGSKIVWNPDGSQNYNSSAVVSGHR